MISKFFITLIYIIIFIISALKLKQLIDSYDSSTQKFYNLKLIFLIFHLIYVSLNFIDNKNFRILSIFLNLSAVITNNLEWSKEEFLSEIKSFDFGLLKKFFFEIGLFLNIFVFFVSQENIIKKEKKEEKKNK